MNKPTLWFAGTPPFAAHSLKALINNDDYQVTGVLTQPDRKQGRGQKIQASAVKNTALAYALPLAQPVELRTPTALFNDIPDLIIVAAYGLLLPEWFLNLPRLGCINIHASLLPRWRGAAPIQRAIEAGDQETGITIMQMDKGLDTGAMWLKKTMKIHSSHTTATLHDELQALGAIALLEALPTILAQKTSPIPQDDTLATYAHKLSKAEAMIDWQQPLNIIERKVRAYNPYPIAQTKVNGEILRIHEATPLDQSPNAVAGTIIAHHEQGIDIACIDGLLRVTRIQRQGKPIVNAADLRHGYSLTGQQCQS